MILGCPFLSSCSGSFYHYCFMYTFNHFSFSSLLKLSSLKEVLHFLPVYFIQSSIKIILDCSFFFFLIPLHGMWTLVPQTRMEPKPLEHGVLTTGLAEKSLDCSFCWAVLKQLCQYHQWPNFPITIFDESFVFFLKFVLAYRWPTILC